MKIQKPDKHFVTIDPGLQGTGYAIWFPMEDDKTPLEGLLIANGVLKETKGEQINRMILLATELTSKISEHLINADIYIEKPQLWTSNSVSMASGSEGDLFALAMLIGVMIGILQISGYTNIKLFTANDWKGQMSKSAVLFRILRRMPAMAGLRDHEADAIGMGLALNGIL